MISDIEPKPVMLAIAAGLAVVALALGPAPPYFDVFDKIAHVCAFALLAALMRRAGVSVLLIVAALGAFAVAIEIAQALFSDGRTASWKDVVASVFGVVIGALLPLRLRPVPAAAAVLALAFAAQALHFAARPMVDTFVQRIIS